jgi:glycosyltransferase involved in cell wall biosynthesis
MNSPSKVNRRICLLPKMTGVGGMVSFRSKMEAGLAARGYQVCSSLKDEPYDAILVIGGTRQLAGLYRARKRGIPILQRLNGMNWIHRKRKTGLRHFLRAELANLLLVSIRNRLASGVVYQSEFARAWWERVYGSAPVPSAVVLNGVDLDQYSPSGEAAPTGRLRMLVVEGHLGGGYEIGLEHALDLAQQVHQRLGKELDLSIAGKAEPGLQASIQAPAGVCVDWRGWVPADQVPALDRSAHLLFASDLHPACPNAVIEALACGLPVVGYDTGALRELVSDGAGEIVPYGGDAWNLDVPDSASLAQAALRVYQAQPAYRHAARRRAENGLDLDTMVTGYLGALGWS